MYTLYILYSENIDRFYVGYTNDLQRRMSEHNRQKKKFTDKGIPWKIVYTEKYYSKKEADQENYSLKNEIKEIHMRFN